MKLSFDLKEKQDIIKTFMKNYQRIIAYIILLHFCAYEISIFKFDEPISSIKFLTSIIINYGANNIYDKDIYILIMNNRNIRIIF